MKTCSTVLFFGEMPYGYDLVLTSEGYQLVPAAFSPHQGLPHFSATQQESQWKVEGAADPDLQEQIQKLLRHQATWQQASLAAAP